MALILSNFIEKHTKYSGSKFKFVFENFRQSLFKPPKSDLNVVWYTSYAHILKAYNQSFPMALILSNFIEKHTKYSGSKYKFVFENFRQSLFKLPKSDLNVDWYTSYAHILKAYNQSFPMALILSNFIEKHTRYLGSKFHIFFEHLKKKLHFCL